MRISRLAPRFRGPNGLGSMLPNGIDPASVVQAEQCAQDRSKDSAACKSLAAKAVSEGLEQIGLPPEYAKTALDCAKTGDPAKCATALMKTHLTGIDLGIYTPENIMNVASCAKSQDATSDACMNVASVAVKLGLEAIAGGWPWSAAIECARHPSVDTCAKAGLKVGVAAGCSAITSGAATPLCGPLASVVGDLIWPAVDVLFVGGPMAVAKEIYSIFGGGGSSRGCGGKQNFDNVLMTAVGLNSEQFWKMVEELPKHWETFLSMHGIKYEAFPYVSSRTTRAPWETDDASKVGTLALFLDLAYEKGSIQTINYWAISGVDEDVEGVVTIPGDWSEGPFYTIANGWSSPNSNRCLEVFKETLKGALEKRWQPFKTAYEEALMAMSNKASEMAHKALEAKLQQQLSVVSRTAPGTVRLAQEQAALTASLGAKLTQGARSYALAPVALKFGQTLFTDRAKAMVKKMGVATEMAATTTGVAKQYKQGIQETLATNVGGATRALPAINLAVQEMESSALKKKLLLGAGAVGLLAVAVLVAGRKS